jgi:hypothetical protein
MCTGAEIAMVTSAVVGAGSAVYSATNQPKPQKLQEAKSPIAAVFRDQKSQANAPRAAAEAASNMLTGSPTAASGGLAKTQLLGQ